MKLLMHANADLVITDMVMPEKEGLEVIKEIRSLFPSLKIIAISGGGRVNPTDYLRMAKFLGATKALAKPISSEALLGAIIETLLPIGESPAQPGPAL